MSDKNRSHTAGPADGQERTMADAVADVLFLTGLSLRGETLHADGLHALRTSLATVYAAARRHALAATCACALTELPPEALSEPDRRAAARFAEEYNRSMSRAAMFDLERGALEAFLGREGIRYMPLKGILLREFYPKPAMRQMVDNDIWFDRAHRETVRDWFAARGYTVSSFGNGHHDTYVKEPIFNFEMHIALFSPALGETWSAYYERKTAEARSVAGSPGRLSLSNEDFYIHILAHEYKHYSRGGIGLRSLADAYVLDRHFFGRLDEAYIRRETEALGIADFARTLIGLARKAMGDSMGTLTDAERRLYEEIIPSATLGTQDTEVRNGLRRMQSGKEGEPMPADPDAPITLGAKVRYLWRRIFPRPRAMRERYCPRHPYLLPFTYVWRWFAIGLGNGKRVFRELCLIVKTRR